MAAALKIEAVVRWTHLPELEAVSGASFWPASKAAAIEQLYCDAFPDEDLLPVIRDLQHETAGVISLTGMVENTLVGHVAFTACGLAGETENPDGNTDIALLGPLAVAPAWQRQGVGSDLVRTGLRELERVGASQVFVLGDPAYYGRFGFESDERVAPPYPLPEAWRAAWQSLRIHAGTPSFCGQLYVPEIWQNSALWSP